MTNWTKYYEDYEEELHSETTRKSVKQTKKKKSLPKETIKEVPVIKEVVKGNQQQPQVQ